MATLEMDIDLEALAAEAFYQEAMQDAEAEVDDHVLEDWREIRREILSRGGIAAGPYTPHWIPGGTYRVNGLPPDVIAADLRDESWGTWESAEEFLAELQILNRAAKVEWDRRYRGTGRTAAELAA